MKHKGTPKNNRIYCYRLYPNDDQERTFAQYFGATRFVWNWALAERKRVQAIKESWTIEQKEARKLQYKLNKDLPKEQRIYFDDDLSAYSQAVNLVKLKKLPEFSWLKDVDAHVPEFVLNDLDEAYKHAFRRLSEGKRGKDIGWPKFKSKKVFGKKSFTTRGIALSDDTKKIISGTATVTCRALRIPKIGKVWLNLDREPIGSLAKVTIKKEPSGRYYAIILANTPIEDTKEVAINPNNSEIKVVGINRGLRRLATLHTGEFIQNPEYYAEAIVRLQYLNRRISRLERYRKHDKNGKAIEAPSKALIKAQLRYNKAMEKVVDKRERYAHHLSKRIVNEFDVIALEAWSPAKLIQQNTKALSFRIADAGWGQLNSQIEYKAKRFGKIVIKLDEFEPLTKIHHKCGNQLNINYRLTTATCKFCNETIDIDVNAAINGRNRAIEALKI